MAPPRGKWRCSVCVADEKAARQASKAAARAREAQLHLDSLSAYEKQRLANIQRNQDMLQQLGF